MLGEGWSKNTNNYLQKITEMVNEVIEKMHALLLVREIQIKTTIFFTALISKINKN